MGKTFTPELHLNGEYLKFFRKVRTSLKDFTGTSSLFNEIEPDIGEMLYSAQMEGRDLSSIVENEDEYITELLRTFYEANPKNDVLLVKIAYILGMFGSGPAIGYLLFNSILLSVLLSIVFVFLYVIFIKNMNEGLDKKMIKTMMIIKITQKYSIVPVAIIGIYAGMRGGYERLVSPYGIFIIIIALISIFMVNIPKLNNTNN